jgi:hypothetical protein
MSRKILIDDDAAQYASIERRLKRLEAGIPEDPHYVGAAGEPAFQNSWTNFDASPSPQGRAACFYRHAGRVYLSGVMKDGASGSTAFVLPDGYRPLAQTPSGDFAVAANAGIASLQIHPDGSVKPIDFGPTSVTGWVFLDGVSFRHA